MPWLSPWAIIKGEVRLQVTPEVEAVLIMNRLQRKWVPSLGIGLFEDYCRIRLEEDLKAFERDGWFTRLIAAGRSGCPPAP